MKLVKLSATWCNPCKTYAPIYDKWKEENPDIEAQSLDIDKDEILESWGIKNVPTTIFLADNGDMITKRVGMMSYEEIQEVVDSFPDE